MNDPDTNEPHPTLFQRWFRRAQTPTPPDAAIQAEQGNADAQFHLGLKYASADGPAQDLGQAVKWYLKAAQQNHSLAQFNLGAMYAGGQGVQPDEAEAEIWFVKAATQGDAGAQHYLGVSCFRASIRDSAHYPSGSRIEAYKWLSLAAAQGYRGSAAARDTVALRMTYAEVAEATRRAGGVMPSLSATPTNP
jgi:TPR repeat protein